MSNEDRVKKVIMEQLGVKEEQISKDIPMSKMGVAADIAYAVAFLASEKAEYITGETIHVNGGLYMQ